MEYFCKIEYKRETHPFTRKLYHEIAKTVDYASYTANNTVSFYKYEDDEKPIFTIFSEHPDLDNRTIYGYVKMIDLYHNLKLRLLLIRKVCVIYSFSDDLERLIIQYTSPRGLMHS